MAKASETLTRLKAVGDGVMAALADVEQKRLFGSDGYFVNGNIFGLVWKEGRLALRLTKAPLRSELLAQDGAEDWGKFWVFVPEAWHSRPAKLKPWCRKAWELALERPAKVPVTRKRSTRVVTNAVFKRVTRDGKELKHGS